MSNSPNVTVVDYGVGNLLSVQRALEECGAIVKMGRSAEDIQQADRLVIPGVGAFGDCVDELHNRSLWGALEKELNGGRPVLGICVGMQMLLDESSEFGQHSGFGLIPGKVESIPDTDLTGNRHKIPHIGWNGLEPAKKGADWANSILSKTAPGAKAYFVHSFAAVPRNDEDCLAVCDYGGRQICVAVKRGNVTGTQFHPEKSGQVGLKILEEFISI